MMQNSKYTVLMSVYYKEKPEYLSLSIESMLNQTVKPDEFIIVKDGPLTTELDEVINNFVTAYPKTFNIIVNETNLGLGPALAKGIENSKNELIARMDSDDYVVSTRCERQLEKFREDPKLGMVGSYEAEFVDDIDNVISIHRVPSENDEIERFMHRRCSVLHPTVMYKKSAVLKSGNYQSVLLYEDYDLFARMVLEYHIKSYNIPEPLYYIRTSEDFFKRRGNKEEESKLLSTLLFSSMIQSVVYFGMYLIITPKLHIENAYFLLLYVILQVFTALFLQFVRGLGESVKYTVASFISATTTTILNVIALVILKMGLQGLFVSTLSAQIVTLIYLIFASKCWEYISPKNIHLSIFKSVGTYSIPLIPNNLAWWVVNASDRTIIAHFLTTAANGIYSVANKFPNVFISFYNILNLSWTETVSLHYGDEDRDEFLTETMTSLFKLFAAACFGIVACMPFVFPIMVNLKYSAAYNQILILMYAMLFRVLVGLYSCVYVAQKNAKKIAYTSISAAIINIAVDLILINKIQVFAASLSTLIAFLSMFIVRYIDVNKTVHMKIRKPIIIGSVLIGGMLIGTYYCGNRMIQFAALCITAVYAVLTNVDMLKSGVNLVKSRLGK